MDSGFKNEQAAWEGVYRTAIDHQSPCGFNRLGLEHPKLPIVDLFEPLPDRFRIRITGAFGGPEPPDAFPHLAFTQGGDPGQEPPNSRSRYRF